MQRLYRSRARRGRIRATIKSKDADDIKNKILQREEKGDDKESGC